MFDKEVPMLLLAMLVVAMVVLVAMTLVEGLFPVMEVV